MLVRAIELCGTHYVILVEISETLPRSSDSFSQRASHSWHSVDDDSLLTSTVTERSFRFQHIKILTCAGA